MRAHISYTPLVKVLRQDLNVPPLSSEASVSKPLAFQVSTSQDSQESEPKSPEGRNRMESILLRALFPTHVCSHAHMNTYTYHPRSVAQHLSQCLLSYHEGKEDRKASPWLCFAILGRPVVPLVKKMTIGSSVFDLIQVWSGDADLQRDSVQKGRSHVSCFGIPGDPI